MNEKPLRLTSFHTVIYLVTALSSRSVVYITVYNMMAQREEVVPTVVPLEINVIPLLCVVDISDAKELWHRGYRFAFETVFSTPDAPDTYSSYEVLYVSTRHLVGDFRSKS